MIGVVSRCDAAVMAEPVENVDVGNCDFNLAGEEREVLAVLLGNFGIVRVIGDGIAVRAGR